jgi:hypothetical protein
MVYALSLGWLAVLAETIAHLFQSVGGYGFTPIQAGLLYLSPLIGTILGSVIGGKVSDILAKVKAYRNNGVYEPESRLLMMIPAILVSTLGLAGYGWSIQLRTHWFVPTLCFGAIYFGCILGSTIAVTYCLDCHKADTIGTQVVLSLMKSKTFSPGYTYPIRTDWYRHPRACVLSVRCRLGQGLRAAQYLLDRRWDPFCLLICDGFDVRTWEKISYEDGEAESLAFY